MNALEWLAAAADPEFPSPPFPDLPDEAAGLRADPDYAAFLRARNGLYAFSRALHIFGADPARPFHDLGARNLPGAWRPAYGPVLEGIWFFAEDVFGNLFGLRKGEALFLDPETANLDKVGMGFRGWAEYLVSDLDYATGGGLAKSFADGQGPIPFEQRLSPKKPFLLGGEFSLDNLLPLPWEQNLGLKADLYRQTKDLPEGASIEIRPQ